MCSALIYHSQFIAVFSFFNGFVIHNILAGKTDKSQVIISRNNILIYLTLWMLITCLRMAQKCFYTIKVKL